jgi:hypothetical protein
MDWARHKARMGAKEIYAKIWQGNLKERSYLEDLDIDGRIIPKWISKKWYRKMWTGLIWLRIGSNEGLL